jgi:hypothetical protein
MRSQRRAGHRKIGIGGAAQPRTVLIDPALITGIDPAGAGVLIEAAAHAKGHTVTLVDPGVG